MQTSIYLQIYFSENWNFYNYSLWPIHLNCWFLNFSCYYTNIMQNIFWFHHNLLCFVFHFYCTLFTLRIDSSSWQYFLKIYYQILTKSNSFLFSLSWLKVLCQEYVRIVPDFYISFLFYNSSFIALIVDYCDLHRRYHFL